MISGDARGQGTAEARLFAQEEAHGVRGFSPSGTFEQVRDDLIDLADSLGANTLLLNFNQGALPHERFVQNLQRFAKEVLPALQAHEVTTVPVH